MITPESELPRHLIPQEPERWAQGISEIERVARQMLREVSEAAAGYQPPGLRANWRGKQLLETTRIDYQVDPLTRALPSAIDAAFAWRK